MKYNTPAAVKELNSAISKIINDILVKRERNFLNFYLLTGYFHLKGDDFGLTENEFNDVMIGVKPITDEMWQTIFDMALFK